MDVRGPDDVHATDASQVLGVGYKGFAGRSEVVSADVVVSYHGVMVTPDIGQVNLLPVSWKYQTVVISGQHPVTHGLANLVPGVLLGQRLVVAPSPLGGEQVTDFVGAVTPVGRDQVQHRLDKLGGFLRLGRPRLVQPADVFAHPLGRKTPCPRPRRLGTTGDRLAGAATEGAEGLAHWPDI